MAMVAREAGQSTGEAVSSTSVGAAPAPASLGGALRAALVDFYFHSGRLVVANLAWGVCLIGILGLALFVAPVALALLPLAAIPAAGVARMAGTIVRGGEFVDARQFRAGMRRRGRAAFGTAAAAVVVTGILIVNVTSGMVQGGVPGWAFATLAAWGLLATWTWTFALWPLLGDPARDDRSLADLARLATTIVLVRPGRTVAGAATIGLLVMTSTALVIVLIGTGVAYASLVASHIVLPVADHLEVRVAVAG